jgi:hypothetical protein
MGGNIYTVAGQNNHMRSPRVAIKIDGKIGKSGNIVKKPHNKAIILFPGF